MFNFLNTLFCDINKSACIIVFCHSRSFFNFKMSTEVVPNGSVPTAPVVTPRVRIIESIVNLLEDTHKVKLLYAQMYGTFLVWIGDPMAPALDNLSMALGTNTTTILTKLSGGMDGADSEMASKLSAKFNEGKPVYVAYNYAPVGGNATLKLAVDKALIEFVKDCVEKGKGQ